MIAAAPRIPDRVKRGLRVAGPHMQRVLEWLESKSTEDCITMGDDIVPLVARSDRGDMHARAILSVLAMFNQHKWLHDRMTFHALADTQEWALAHRVAPLEERHWTD